MALFGLDIAALASALMMNVVIEACPVGNAPKVEVHFATEPLYYSEDHAAAALKKSMAKDKESTLATDRRTVVFGVTTSVTSASVSTR